MDRGAWRARESDTTEQLTLPSHFMDHSLSISEEMISEFLYMFPVPDSTS